jgi:CHAD domain-containing protein
MPTRESELLRKRLDSFTRPLAAAEQGDIGALHRVRVASRRLRELLPLLPLDRDASKKINRRLRKVTKRLGTVRELDVLLLLIEELHESRRFHGEALSRVAVAVSKERDDAREHLFKRLPIDNMRRIARKLGRAVDHLDASRRKSRSRAKDAKDPGPAHDRGHARGTDDARTARWSVEVRLARRAARLTTAIVDAGAVYLPGRLHDVRIALKKMRYVVELANEIAAQPTTAELRSLKRGQDILGRVHDVQVLIDRVRQVQASLTPPTIAVWRALDTLVTALDDDCRRLHARYMHLRPVLEVVASRLGAPAPVSGTRARRAVG